jgi:hypothetical protein
MTDPAGTYVVANLPGGEYLVEVDIATVPPGMIETADPDGVLDSATRVVLGAGSSETDVDFGYTGSGSIGDLVWFDADGDGAFDAGEPGMADVGLRVTWAGPDGVFASSDDVTIDAVTATDGRFTVDRLPAGQYVVAVDPASVPPGMTPSFDPDGGLDSTALVVLAAGADDQSVDFGYTGTGEVSGRLWLDQDGNGVRAGDEPSLDGIEVSLRWFGADGVAGGGDDVVSVSVTDSNGRYTFAGLPAGEYRATVDYGTLPPGLAQTYDPDAVLDGTTVLALSDGESHNDVDFGYTGTASLSGMVFRDTDNDGIRDAGESGIGGVGITATWAGPDAVFGTPDDVKYRANADAAGAYGFAGLPAGNVRVAVVTGTIPVGLTSTTGGNSTRVTIPAGGSMRVDDYGYGSNQPPVAVDDTATTRENTPVLINVLGNDRDPNGDELELVAVGKPSHGTAVLNPDGTLTYTPDAGFTGDDHFVYTVCEKKAPFDVKPLCDTATVSVVVIPVNDPPTINEGAESIQERLAEGERPAPLRLADPNDDTVTLRVTGGTVPPGLALYSDGTWGGEATSTGTYTIDVEACDDGQPILCTTSVVTIVIGILPFTGSELASWVMLGAALVLVGLVILWASRRRGSTVRR